MSDISDHAIDRIRERLGVNKKAAERIAQQAENGLLIEDCGGRLRRFLDAMRHKYGQYTSNYRVTPQGIFAYQGKTMTTVIPVPPEFRKTIMTHWKKHRSQDQ